MELAKKLRIEKIIFCIVFVLIVIVPLFAVGIWALANGAVYNGIMLIILSILGGMIIIVLVWLGASCAEYDYEGKKILVYCGFYHHFMQIDGTVVDEHNTLLYITPINLSNIDESGVDYESEISLTGRIKMKINGKLYRGKYIA